MKLSTLAITLLVTLAAGDEASLNCPLRAVGLNFAQSLQPFRPLQAFQEVADALNGAADAINCTLSPNPALAGPAGTSRVGLFSLPTTGQIVYADPVHGSDTSDGLLITQPLRTLARALELIVARRAGKPLSEVDRVTVVLRAGTFYHTRALTVGAVHSFVTFQAFPGEEVFLSGGVPLTGKGLKWAPTAAPTRAAYEFRAGSLADGFDAYPAGLYTVAQAQAICSNLDICAGFTYASASPQPTTPILISFKYETFFASGSNAGTWVKNYGYANGTTNLWVADVSSLELASSITGLRVNGVRAIRARYPNVKTVEQIDAMQIIAESWTPQPMGTNANYTFNPPFPLRNDSAQGYFQTFRLGVGGPCAQRFTPQASYWCSSGSQGGGPGPYQAPVGLVADNSDTSLPHTPYAHPVSGAAVHSWRAGRWFSWVFEVDGFSFDTKTNKTTLSFSLDVGGNQGSRGGNAGQEFFIENVLDELDAPGEFYFDPVSNLLYLWHNSSDGGAPPVDGSIVATQSTVIFNATGDQQNPVTGLGFLGLGFRDSAPNFLGPHGTPSGGDWAVGRSAAVFFEGTVDVLVQGCLFSTLDGNALFFSGFTRNATVSQNEFYSIGESAVSQWGYTDGSPVPNMGFDATAGNQPRGTKVLYNLVHEVGLWTKQNSFYFQSESFGNIIEGNIAYNGPRAGINFDDGLGGGSLVTKNVLFNFCRESSDHGPFNSWNRVVYLFDDDNGQPTVNKKNDTISFNFMIANYHSSMAIDNDDGSAFFDTHDNVFIAAANGAAYGGNSLKSDFGGHSNFHHGNLDLFWTAGYGVCPQLQGFSDGYYDNFLWLAKDGNYGSGACTAPGKTIVFNNTVWSPTGAITECGTSLANWQKQGNDAGTVGLPYPSDAEVLALATKILGFAT